MMEATSLKRQRFIPGNVQVENIPDIPNSFWGTIYKTLFDHFGDPYWWPGNNDWEVAVGAVLTQNTSWTNVELSLNALYKHQIVSPERLLSLDEPILADLIRSSGYYNQKARKLKNLAVWWIRHVVNSDISTIPDLKLRTDLLSIWGIGPETADSIACYAFGRPFFVVDAYTIRIRNRMLGLNEKALYESVQNEVHLSMPSHPLVFNFLHGLLVTLGKYHCKSKNPDCLSCPLNNICEYAK